MPRSLNKTWPFLQQSTIDYNYMMLILDLKNKQVLQKNFKVFGYKFERHQSPHGHKANYVYISFRTQPSFLIFLFLPLHLIIKNKINNTKNACITKWNT
jgi:hypothetical protein